MVAVDVEADWRAAVVAQSKERPRQELGQLNRRQVAALMGVAPFCSDSGRHRGPRHIRGGRPALRSTLYMATLTARTFNPLIRATAERLTRGGKPFKVVMIACMRKLLTMLNTIVKTGRAWHAPAPTSVV